MQKMWSFTDSFEAIAKTTKLEPTGNNKLLKTALLLLFFMLPLSATALNLFALTIAIICDEAIIWIQAFTFTSIYGRMFWD